MHTAQDRARGPRGKHQGEGEVASLGPREFPDLRSESREAAGLNWQNSLQLNFRWLGQARSVSPIPLLALPFRGRIDNALGKVTTRPSRPFQSQATSTSHHSSVEAEEMPFTIASNTGPTKSLSDVGVLADGALQL